MRAANVEKTAYNKVCLRGIRLRRTMPPETFDLTARPAASPSPHCDIFGRAVAQLSVRCFAKPFYARPNVVNKLAYYMQRTLRLYIFCGAFINNGLRA
jgi:hypothetical protein